jgi:hypothetical protein
MFIASELGKFEHEVAELSPDEIARWVAFYRIREKDREKRNRKNKPGAKR